MTILSLPGVIDAHVHLREPGATHKEDIASGTRAALAGGVIALLDMPNNIPPTVDGDTFLRKEELFVQRAHCDYGLFVGYDGTRLESVLEVAERAVGVKLYLDETFGDLTITEPAALAALFEAWPGPGPIAVHGEGPSIATALTLAHRYGQRLVVCHVPHPDDLLRIDRARQAGTIVYAEVTPHHLFLSAADLPRLGSRGQMKPPLVTPQEVRRFWEHLDLVDLIATDHAPHTVEEKASVSPPPGVPGLETLLPLMLYAVDRGRLTLERLVELTHSGPLRTYGLCAPADSDIEVEIGEAYALAAEGYHTRCGWSPFAGLQALGRVRRVRLRGRDLFDQGRILAQPGDGQALRRAPAATLRETGGRPE